MNINMKTAMPLVLSMMVGFSATTYAGGLEVTHYAVPGDRQLVTFSVESIEYHLTLATTEIVIAGERERLISLQVCSGDFGKRK